MVPRFFVVLLVGVMTGCASTSPLVESDLPAPDWNRASNEDARMLTEGMPSIQREFRAAWVATVDNIDWPSKPGLTSSEQQNEMRDLLDRARMMNLNAIILQIRPTADALYRSDKEPWSYYLTGENGLAPDPFYDPLEFAVEEAHRRGIELHVWFNPYRAYHPTAPDSLSENHVFNQFPGAVHRYGTQLWMDPGAPEVTDHSLDVIMDVVERYDIDGVHMDDYFYPYPVNDEAGNRVDFPDSSFYAVYGTGLSKEDWRRRNVDDLVLRIHTGIKKRKPWVLFGISPFGIWRPGYPEGITGFDAYANLYADAKKWLNEGWVDYYTPQLYWALESTGQPYGPLLDWWIEENTKGVHMWPGNFTSRIILEDASHWEPEEILAQVSHTRRTKGASGNVHFSMRALTPPASSLSDQLTSELYSEKAIIPASTWIYEPTPSAPEAGVRKLGDRLYLAMTPSDDVPVRNWTLRVKDGLDWKTKVVPGWNHAVSLDEFSSPEVVVLQAVTRLGRESEAVVLHLVK